MPRFFSLALLNGLFCKRDDWDSWHGALHVPASRKEGPTMDIKLRVLKGHHIDREFTIPTPKCLVGRGDECQMRARSEAVSRRHCASHPETRRLRLDETTRSPLQDPTVPEQQHPPTTKKTRNHRHPGKLPRRSAPKPKSDSNFSTSLSSLPFSTQQISLGIKVALDRRRHLCHQCQI